MLTTSENKHLQIKNNKFILTCFIFSLIVSIGFYLFKGLGHPEMVLDDAYFFIRYADNFLAGFGHAWNSDGVQVYGSTSLLHFLVVVCFRWCLPFQDFAILQLSSSIMGFAAIILMVVICSHYTKWQHFHKNYLFWAAILFPLFFLNDIFIIHMLSGMDTMLVLFCNVLLILFTLRLLSRRRTIDLILLILSAFLAYFARPDNAVYVFLFPVMAISLLSDSINKRALVVKFIVCLAVLITIDLIVKTCILGDPLPLSFYAKQSGFYENYAGAGRWNPISLILQFIFAALPFLVIILLLGEKEDIRLLAVFLFPAVIIFLYYFSVTQIMGGAARYYFPTLPFFAVCSVMIIDSRLENNTGFFTITKRRIMLIVIILLPISLLDNLAGYYKRHIIGQITLTKITDYTADFKRPLPEVGYDESIIEIAKIAKKAPKGTIIALSEHGYISASAPHVDIIDPLGLHDKYFAHNGFSAKEFFVRQPDFIWFPHPDYTHIVREILKSKDLWRDYYYYPTAYDYGIAIRKSSLHFDSLMDIISESWQANYGAIQMKDNLAKPLHIIETD